MSVFEETLRHLLAAGIGARFRASGDSMHPTIRDGDYVRVEPCAPSQLQRGDVVLATTARGLTLHRIVNVGWDVIITRGDNALRSDGAVGRDRVLGRVAIVENIPERSRRFDASLKIIRVAAVFARTLRHRFQQHVVGSVNKLP